MTAAFVVFAAMAITDTFDVAKTVFIEQRRRLLTTLCDWLMEVGDYVWLGAGIASVINHGFTAEVVYILAAMLAGSFVGAEIGDRASHWADAYLDRPQEGS